MLIQQSPSWRTFRISEMYAKFAAEEDSMSDNDFVSFENDLDQEDLASHRAHRCTPQEARDRLTAGNLSLIHI